MMMNSKKSFSEANKSSLFVGNLSILCDEDALRKLFLPFGPVSSVRIKRGDDPQRSHLSYGFVDFVSIESADRAMQLNNVIFLGRALKIGRAEDFATRRSNRKNQLREAIEGTNNHSIPPTAQIHVSFATRQTQRPFCELQLRQVFGQFPNLVDVAIKKNMANPSIGLQSGYAFVHYSMDDAGIRSALAAVECLNGRTADGVKYECSVTHGLKTFLQASHSYQGRQSPVSIASSDQYYQAPYSPTSMNKSRDNSFRVIPYEEQLPSPISYNGWNSGSSMSLSSVSSSSSSSYINLLERENYAPPIRLAAVSGDDMMNYIEQQVLLLVDEN